MNQERKGKPKKQWGYVPFNRAPINPKPEYKERQILPNHNYRILPR